jgi:hypothetical protein
VGIGGAPAPVFFFQKFIRNRDRLDFRARLLIVSIIVTPVPFLLSMPDSVAVVAIVCSEVAGRVGQLCDAVVFVLVREGLMVNFANGEMVAGRSVESSLVMLVPRVLGDRGILLVVALVA